MKNFIVGFALMVVIISPSVSLAQTSVAGSADAQKNMLISLLLEKVKSLQAELAALISEKSKSVKVEIISQNSEYRREVSSWVDSLEEKETLRKVLMVKLEQSQCMKPYRYIAKGVTTFKCRDTNPTFTATTTIAEIVPISVKSENYIKDIKALDIEISDINTKILALKTRYGI